MNPLFDYEYVCFMFSGLRGWVPLTAQHEITPESPVTFVHDDSHQTAIFRVDHVGNFQMDIYDEQGNSYSKIVECSQEYMESEFGSKMQIIEITPPLPEEAEVSDATGPFTRISKTKWARGNHVTTGVGRRNPKNRHNLG
jgi:hypothetical protein